MYLGQIWSTYLPPHQAGRLKHLVHNTVERALTSNISARTTLVQSRISYTRSHSLTHVHAHAHDETTLNYLSTLPSHSFVWGKLLPIRGIFKG